MPISDTTVQGICFEYYDQISQIAQIINDYLRYDAFKSQNGKKLRFTEEMRFAFSRCVGTVIAVPVTETDPKESIMRYVLEVDITPASIICEDLVFKTRLSNVFGTAPGKFSKQMFVKRLHKVVFCVKSSLQAKF